jgi:hypothetical protein
MSVQCAPGQPSSNGVKNPTVCEYLEPVYGLYPSLTRHTASCGDSTAFPTPTTARSMWHTLRFSVRAARKRLRITGCTEWMSTSYMRKPIDELRQPSQTFGSEVCCPLVHNCVALVI